MEFIIFIILLSIVYLEYADFSPRKPKVCEGCGSTNPQWESYVVPKPSWSKKKAKVSHFKCKRCGYIHRLPIK